MLVPEVGILALAAVMAHRIDTSIIAAVGWAVKFRRSVKSRFSWPAFPGARLGLLNCGRHGPAKP